MNVRRVACLVVCVLLSATTTAWAVCPQGPSDRPEINYRGWDRDSLVAFSIDSSVGVGDKFPCIADGIKRWNGVNGVTLEQSQLVSNPTASFTIKCCMPASDPQWSPNVVAFVDGQHAQRSGSRHIVHVDILTGPLWDSMVSQMNCDSFAKVLAHETAHTFGLGHTPNGSGNLTQGNIALGPNGTTPGWNGFPSDCEKDRAKNALTARTGDGGNKLPGDQSCEKDGFPGYGDNKNCCLHGTAFTVTRDNVLPTGHLTTLNSTTFNAGASGYLTIHAYDLDSHIARVAWYVNDVNTYNAYSQPFSAPFANAPAGVYLVKARIYDDSSTGSPYVMTNTIMITVGGYYATNTLQTASQLFPGYVLVSANQGYYAQLGSDGRFNLYTSASALIASTWTYGLPLHLRMDEDGNAVLRHQPFNAVWQTYTGSWNNREAALRVLDSGKVAIVRQNGTVIWQYP